MHHFKKTSLAIFCGLAITTLLTGCGGGGSDTKDAAAAIQGGANKGIFKHAKIEIFKIESGVVDSSPLAAAITDDAGKYSVDINYSGPVLVVASKLDSTSMMTCDILPSCDGGITFGNDLPIPNDLTLKAAANVSSGNQSISITSLTHLAAKLAEVRGFNTDVIAVANSQVANLFKLAGSLTQFSVVNITDNTQFDAASAVEQRNALLSAAIYGAARAKGLSLDQVAEIFANRYGQLLGNTTGTDIDLEDILFQAQEIISAPNFTGDAATLAANLITDLQAANDLGEGETNSQPSPDVLSSDMKKAQALVSDLRNIGTSVDLQAKSDVFAQETKIAKQLLSKDIESVVKSLGYSMEAIDKLKKLRGDNSALTSPQSIQLTKEQWNYNSETWTWSPETIMLATVVVNFTGDTYTVNSVVTGVNVNITALVDVHPDETPINNGTSTHVVANEKIDISGVVSNANIEFKINKGLVTLALLADITETANTTAESVNDLVLTNGNMKFDLDVAIKQKQTVSGLVELAGAVTDEETTGNELTGHFTATMANVAVLHSSSLTLESCLSETPGPQCVTYMTELQTQQKSAIVSFKNIAITFMGKLSNTTLNNAISINFATGIQGNNVTLTENSTRYGGCYVNNDNLDSSYAWCESGLYNPETETYIDGAQEVIAAETVSKFFNPHFSLDVDLRLAGISNETSIHLGGSRSSLNNASLDGSIAFDGKRYSFDIPVERTVVNGKDVVKAKYLQVTNQNNVILKVAENNSGEMTGSISLKGVKYANISQQNGLTFIRYTNGQFETLE